MIRKIIFFWLLLASTVLANPNSVCLIRIEPSLDGKNGSLGSGFFIGKNSVLTAYHVVNKEDRRIRIEYRNRIYDAEVIKEDPVTDLALLIVEGVENPSILYIDDTEPKKSEKVYNLGHPNGMWNVYRSSGNIKETKIFEYEEYKSYCHVINAIVKPGMSGGPCINEETGKCIGLLARYNKTIPIAYNTSFIEIRKFLLLENSEK